VLLLSLVAAMVAIGCGNSDSESTLTPTTTMTTTSEVPIPERPVKILFVGDSMVEGVRPPIEAAFGTPEFTFAKDLVPGFVNETVSDTPIWPDLLAAEQPDVIVTLFGVWENAAIRSGEFIDTTEADWLDTYRAEMVEPVVEGVLAAGAEWIWVSMTTVRDRPTTEQFLELNEVWRSVADDHDAIHWVSSQDLLTDDADEFLEFDPDPDADFPRLINPDGLHLCAGAGFRLAPPIIETIEDLTGAAAVPNWSTSSWSTDPFGYIPGECN